MLLDEPKKCCYYMKISQQNRPRVRDVPPPARKLEWGNFIDGKKYVEFSKAIRGGILNG